MLTPEQIIESAKKVMIRSAEAYGVSTENSNLDRELTAEEIAKVEEGSVETGATAHCAGLHVEPDTIARAATELADTDDEWAGFAFGLCVGLQVAKDYKPFEGS